MCKQKEEVPVRLLAGGIQLGQRLPGLPTSVPLPIRTAVSRSARLLAVRITTAAAMLAHPRAGGIRTGAAGPARLVAPGTGTCLLYTSPSPRDGLLSRMPSSA